MVYERKSASIERILRIGVLGAKKVGKTSMITRLLKKRFPDKYSPTIETLFRYDIQTSEKKFTKLEILDTAGNFEFPEMLRKAVRSCHAFVLMFDLNDSKQTFREVETLRQLILDERSGESVPIIVIANKSDSVVVKDSEENKVLDAVVSIDWDCTYLTTSAKCDTNISDVYNAVCKGLGIKVRQDTDVNQSNKDATPKISKTTLMKRRFSIKSF
ncbi:GTP-binding protein Di-Ras1-like [Crassostrea angulata]|uniref:GTP-binding protein Di-Ras1-like n=1 Tax=Magallana angulata TaxID=2784310 RepID=UPI0022B0D3D9|nr:GTP-binding protein Di-Ras1-like [Crassostrea angulata]